MTAKDDNTIQIWAAMSPAGEIVKSSIGSFRIHAMRYAQTRKNFTVVKLAEIKANVQGTAKRQEAEKHPLSEVEVQHIDTKIEVPMIEPREVRTRRRKASGE